MTTPDVPLRMELSFELDATPEQVWDAIATTNGIASWFLPTDVEEREGGTIVTHIFDVDSPGTVTGWDPPTRFEYIEPEWASMSGQEGAAVTPLATEFLVEATSGGTCVLRVVSSAFGTGADWEREMFEEMEKGWRPYFDRLRLYLRHFPGREVTTMAVQVTVAATPVDAMAAVRRGLAIEGVGQRAQAHGLTGVVERLDDEDVLVRLDGALPGFLALVAWGDAEATVTVHAQLFADDAPAYVEREAAAWRTWLEAVVGGDARVTVAG